jgi:uncharacterized membrane protein (DUF373 family)
VQILLGCKENEFFHRKTCQVFCALFIRGGVVTIFDFKELTPMYILATATVVLALGVTYWLISKK